jgi:hypothetical protein
MRTVSGAPGQRAEPPDQRRPAAEHVGDPMLRLRRLLDDVLLYVND